MALRNYEVKIPTVLSCGSLGDRTVFILVTFVRFHEKDGSEVWLIYFSSYLCTDSLNKFLFSLKSSASSG